MGLRSEPGTFFAFFGLAFGLYLWALRTIGRWERESRPPSHSRLLLGGVFGVAVAARLAMLGTPPMLSGDVYRYRWDGKVQSAGIDPYRYAPDAPELAFLSDAQDRRINFPHLRTVYPPLTQGVFRLGERLGGTVTAHKAVFVGSELLTVLALFILLRRRGRSLLWLAAYLWHPLVILEIAGSGHNDALGTGWLWLSVAALAAGRWGSAALASTAAFLSKFVSVILIPWWYRRPEARRALWLFLAMAILPMLLHPTAISALVESFSAMAPRAGTNASLTALLAGWSGNLLTARVLAVGGLVLFLLVWARRCEDPVRYLGGALAAAAVCAPALHPWYLVWVVPVFCFWRPSWLVALTGTVVFSYAQGPGWLFLEYFPVAGFAAWEVGRWIRRSSFRLAMKPAPSARF